MMDQRFPIKLRAAHVFYEAGERRILGVYLHCRYIQGGSKFALGAFPADTDPADFSVQHEEILDV